MKWQIYWQIYPPVLASSGQAWQFDISTVRDYIGRSNGQSTPLVVASSGQECILGDQVEDLLADLPPSSDL